MAILLRFSINYYVELPLVGQAAMEKLEWPEWVDTGRRATYDPIDRFRGAQALIKARNRPARES